MEFSKGSEAFEFMGELFSLMRKTSTPQEDKEYWNTLINAIEILIDDYGKTPQLRRFVWHMSMGYMNFLESEYKNEEV